jgi:hypothetical protein
MKTPGLDPAQGPPLAVPFTFFLTAPVAVAAAGALLLSGGASVILSAAAPRTLLLTHLGTMGFLGMTMFGALLQMAPVVAGAAVRPVRLAYAVHLLLAAGLLALGLGATGVVPLLTGLHAGFLGIEGAVVLFLAMTGTALARTPARGDTVTGMRFALGSLALAALIGAGMELAYVGVLPLGDRGPWIRAHFAAAFLGWIGGLIGAVAWQVLPMFYLAVPVPAHRRKAVLGLTAMGVAGPVVALLCMATSPGLLGARWLVAVAALPAAFAVWVLHPLWLRRCLAERKRARADASLLFWRTGLGLAPLLAGVAAWAAFSPDPRAGILLVVLAVWGWAGVIVHGMLARIVPFLVWFHRFSHLIGRVPVPSVRGLLPDGPVRAVYAAHVATLVALVVAVLTRTDAAARIAGGGLVLTAILVARAILMVLARRPAALPATPAAPPA